MNERCQCNKLPALEGACRVWSGRLERLEWRMHSFNFEVERLGLTDNVANFLRQNDKFWNILMAR